MGQMTGNLFGAAGTAFIMEQTGPVVITIIIASVIALCA
jgi:preprotein translocase subunit SecG